MAQLEKNQKLLDDVPIRVLIITFGCQEGALQWLQDTSCPYDMLLDTDRRLYQAFGLGTSVAKVWNLDVMFYYGELKASLFQLPKPYEGIKDDPLQLGGDFGLDENGTVIYLHPGKSPTDRPSVLDIIKFFQQKAC